MSTSIRSGRAQALVSWAAAVLLLSLILWLSGALPLGAFDDVLSVGAAASALVVFVLISGEVRKREPWASVTLVLGHRHDTRTRRRCLAARLLPLAACR